MVATQQDKWKSFELKPENLGLNSKSNTPAQIEIPWECFDDLEMVERFAMLDAQAANGEISEDEALSSPRRNALTSAVSGGKIARIDLPEQPMTVRKHDRILLASDGIDSLTSDEIAAILGDPGFESASEIVDALLSTVKKKGVRGQDNTTAVVIVPSIDSLGKTQPVGRRS